MSELFPENLQALLNDLDAKSLRALLKSLYGLSPEVDSRITLGLKRSDHSEFAKLIKARLSGIKRGKKFISYYEGAAFANSLQALADDIAVFGEHNPKVAFELFLAFMDLHRSVLDRADDSNGYISDVFRWDGVKTLIKLARAYRADPSCQVDWLGLIEARHLDNPYAAWDHLICKSLGLLSEDELMTLNARFEQRWAQFQQSQAENADKRRFSFEGIKIKTGLSAIAEALKNIELYERAETYHNKEPNEIQKLNIAKFCLKVGDATRALYWLDSTEWEHRFMGQRDELLDEALKAAGHTERLSALRQVKYMANPCKANLEALADTLPAEQAEELTRHALTKVLAIDAPESRIRGLVEFNAIDLAANEVLEYAPQLETIFYSTLLNWIKNFQEHRKNSENKAVWLAMVLCYRCLIKQILQEANSKIYHHAVKYVKALQGLDAQAVLHDSHDYSPHPNHLQFMNELRVLHSRKTAFWREL